MLPPVYDEAIQQIEEDEDETPDADEGSDKMLSEELDGPPKKKEAKK